MANTLRFPRGRALGVELFEIACNWRAVTNIKNAKELPPIARHGRVELCERITSVLLPIPLKPDLDILRIRDWVNSYCPNSFRMYNRFQVEERKYRTDRQFLGTNFRFEDATVAATFKLFWV